MTTPTVRTSTIARAPRFVRIALATSATLIASVLVAVLAGGGTYAMLNSSQPTASATTISSGTAALTLSTDLVLPTTPLYPGKTIYGPVRVTNSGDAALTLRVQSLTGPATPTAFSQALTVGVATASSLANCRAGTVTSSWTTGTFASPPAASFGTSVAKGTLRVVCVSVMLSSSVPASVQGQSVPSFTITLDGIQS